MKNAEQRLKKLLLKSQRCSIHNVNFSPDSRERDAAITNRYWTCIEMETLAVISVCLPDQLNECTGSNEMKYLHKRRAFDDAEFAHS